MKIPSVKGVFALYIDQDLACVAEETSTPGQKNVHNLNKERPKVKEPSQDEPQQQTKEKPTEETKEVLLFEGNTRKQVTILVLLDEENENKLTKFLHDSNDFFAWSVEDLRGVDRSIIEHNLEVNKNLPLVKQKLHKMLEERHHSAKA